MAIVNTKATAITNRDADPAVLTNAVISRAALLEAVGTIETVSGDSVGSTYRMGQIPSNARVSQLLLYADDIGTTTAADFGLYQTTKNGGAVVDADFFASAVALNAAALNAVDITHEAAGAYEIADVELRLWEALGLSEDPRLDYDIVATLTGIANGVGTISLKMRYAE